MKNLTTIFLLFLFAFALQGQTVILGDAQYGSVMNVSNCKNSSAYAYDTFDGISSTGFHAVSNANNFDVGGTEDELSIITGCIYKVVFDLVLTSGQLPQIALQWSFGGTILSGALLNTTAGNNVFILAATGTTTGVLSFYNKSKATNFTISNLSVKKMTKEAGFAITYDNKIITEKYWTQALQASITYSGDQSSIIVRLVNGKKIDMRWGDGSITKITGTGNPQTITSSYTSNPSVNQMRVCGDVDQILSWKQLDNKYVYYNYSSFVYLTSLDSLYMKTTLPAYSTGSNNLKCSSLVYLYDYNCGIPGILNNDFFPNLIYFYSYKSGSCFEANLATLPFKLEYLYYAGGVAHGENTINNLPVGLIHFACSGGIIYTGHFDNMPSTLYQIDIQDRDIQFDLDLDNLPDSLWHVCMGYINANWYGSINSFKNFPEFKRFDARGGTGGENMTGNIDSLPSGFGSFSIWDIPTSPIIGTLAGYPRDLCILRINNCGNGVTGGIEDVSVNTTWFTMINNSSFTYAGGAVPEFVKIERFYIQNSWTTNLVDNFLINLASTAVVAGSSYHLIDLSGTNQARSAASDAAVTDLEGRGFTVTTN